MKNFSYIEPGSSLGVLGGGQLGRMFVHAAQQMGYGAVVLAPEHSSPGGRVADKHLVFADDDAVGWQALGSQVSAVTTEFENVSVQALQTLAHHCVVVPGAGALAVCQDRSAEKAHFLACEVPCAPHVVIQTQAQLDQVGLDFFPAILKTLRMGYDGKGQQRVDSALELAQAWKFLNQVPCILEKRVALRHEMSVIVARSQGGEVVHFPVQQNLHRDGILALTQVPAPDVPLALQQQAIVATETIAAKLDYVGVLCVEFFVLEDGRLVANEMAPRPHNSGHYTLDACDVSQFELQVRTLTNSPLVAPRLHSCAVMLNLLGDLWLAGDTPCTPPWDQVLALPGVHLHLYGKGEPRVGRKMGHLTVTSHTLDGARAVALQASALLGLAPW
jgi:5-(carboxyamino)imidazole ribonucleotide synthase